MPECKDCLHFHKSIDVGPCRSCYEICRGEQSNWEPAEPPAPGPSSAQLSGPPRCNAPAVVAGAGGSAGYVGFPDARPEPLGVKLDDEKTRWDLVPWPALELVAQALTLGAAKYPEPENWRRVPNARRRYFAAAIRHAVAWLRGERLDPESGLPHLAHLACNALFLLSFDLDDAPPPALEEP